MNLFDCYAVSDIHSHGNAYSYRAIPAHLSQSGDWVCNVNGVESPVPKWIHWLMWAKTWGKPVFAGLQITKATCAV